MNKYILAIFLLLWSVMSSAYPTTGNTIDTSDLTPDQKAAILAQVSAMQQKTTPSEVARTEAVKWIELGGNMGKAAAGAAKEIGMAANDFATTPLGKATMVIVAYKIVGRDIVKLFVGVLFLIFSWAFCFYVTMKKNYRCATYETVPCWFGHSTKQVIKSFEFDDDAATYNRWFGGVIAAFGTLCALPIIF